MSAWISPGTSRWNSFRWPSTIVGLVAHAARDVVEAVDRLAEPDEPDAAAARGGAKSDAADGERRRERQRSGDGRL